MALDDDKTLLERAFATGASSISIRRWPTDGFRATITAFQIQRDGMGRSISQLADAEGTGATAAEALADALGKLAVPELAPGNAMDALEATAADAGDLGPPPGAPALERPRYAMVGRPGVFVTAEDAKVVRTSLLRHKAAP
jgi:hypothetical protein